MVGELKRIKSFWSSEKDIYKLEFPYLKIKADRDSFVDKFDLRLYQVTLSKKDNKLFYLIAKSETLQLPKLEF